jgi:hypothetical protein
MSRETNTPSQPQLRGADINSLLRLYDTAKTASANSPSQIERVRALRTVELIARELERRKIVP